MDPITGLTALAGITLASIAGLRLKKKMEEGFAALPDTATNYPQSVQESQSRYNMFSGLVNPITNSILPVGTAETKVSATTQLVKDALGSYDANFSPQNTQTLVLNQFKNDLPARSDTNKSLYGAMKFCRNAGKQSNPFTTYNSDGSVKVQGAVSPDGQWKFDEVCGVCLTSGVDEEGNRFRSVQGMVVDPNALTNAKSQQETNGWPFPRIGPAIGSCEGAPNSAAFATSAADLAKFKARQACLNSKEIGGTDKCGYCFDSDGVYSSVLPTAQTYPVYFVLQGVGTLTLQLKGVRIGQKVLSDTSPSRFELTGAKEGDSFSLRVDPPSSGGSASIYGYLESKTPRDGLYTMPLNLLVTVDDETGSSPSKSGGFPNFPSIGLSVATISPGPGKSRMRLRGSLPFTFVQPSEFAALDCLDGPYQTRKSSLSAFSTDQPCYARGSGPGNYNDACLKQRILDAGCTNAGSLYANPSSLNTKNGVAQSISEIYTALQAISSKDMVNPEATKQCSGRTIQTPCDPFVLRQGTLKFGSALQGTDATLKDQASQCLSFLYHNKGASELVNPPRVGPTYTGPSSYKNNQQVIKNLYCLPDGALNPDTNASGKETLVRIADTGYKGRVGVDAIKLYLSDQLALATDMQRNANTDPDRKAAIDNCFGPNLTNLPAAVTGTPQVVNEGPPPGYVSGLYVRFFEIVDANPDIVPGNRGWGNRIGTAGAYTTIQFNDGNLARSDACALVAVGYYVAYGPETLYLSVDSDDGIYVSFNNVQRISNWTIHGPTTDASAPIQIPAAGVYPFELRFYEWGGGAMCNLSYRLNNETTWRTDLSARFAYNPADLEQQDQEFLAKRQGQFSLSSITPKFNNVVGSVKINGDYILSMTIRPTQKIGDWGSIIRFSIASGNCCNFGQRAPAIWFWPNDTRLHVRIGDATDGNWGLDTSAIPLNQNSTFRLECKGSNVTLRVNNEVITAIQPSRRATGTATIYMGDVYYSSAICKVTNLNFSSS